MTAFAERRTYFRGETVVLDGFDVNPNCTSRDTIFETDNDRDDVSFGLRINRAVNFDAPASIDATRVLNGEDADRNAFDYCLSSENAGLTITPNRRVGQGAVFWLQLVAQGPRNRVKVTEPWQVRVGVREPFALNSIGDGQSAKARVEADIEERSGNALSQFQQNDTFQVQAFVPSDVANNQSDLGRYTSYFEHFTVARDGSPQVSLEVCSSKIAVNGITIPATTATDGSPSVCSTSLGDDMFIIASSGKMLLRLGELGTHAISLRARGGQETNPITILSWQMHVRRGPNGTECVRNQGEANDTISDVYTCVCRVGYTGENCELQVVVAATAAATEDSTIAASLGAVVFLMLVALAAVRVQVHRLKHRPVDVGITQEEVLASLGLAATQDIGRAELGINLLFDRAVARTDIGAVFKADLVAVLRRSLPQLKGGLQAAKITGSDPASRRVLLVLPRNKITLPAEAIVELLAGKASKGKLAIDDGGSRVVDASIAIPRRVPREVPRSALTRIMQLGEGAFGEVHQYQLKEKSMPSFFVAAKSIKRRSSSGSAETRDALLREGRKPITGSCTAMIFLN